jgi:hypothetical protein
MDSPSLSVSFVCFCSKFVQSVQSVVEFLLVAALPPCGAIHESCAFSAELPERCAPMTTDKFSMTNSQFRPFAPLRLCPLRFFFSGLAELQLTNSQ